MWVFHVLSFSFREACTQVAKKYFPELWNEKRIEFLPVDWRTSLTLDDGMVMNYAIYVHGFYMRMQYPLG